MTAGSRAVPTLNRRLFVVLMVRQLLLWLACWSMLWGLVALVARLGFDASRSSLAWGIAALPVFIAGAVFHAWRSMPGRHQLAALVDAYAQGGGLLMASGEVELGGWTPEIRRVPVVRWRASRETALAILSAAFAAAVIFVPARATETRRPLQVGNDVSRLVERVEVLREENVIDDAQAEVMTKTLEEVRRDASGDDPAKAWDALDSVDDATMRAAREAGEDAVEQGGQLTRLEAMAFALGSDAVDASQLTTGMRDLAAELDAIENQSSALATLDPTTKAAIDKLTLSSEQLEEIAAAARAGKKQLRATLEKLRERGLIDPKTLRQFEDAARFADRADLARFLRKNAGVKLSTSVGEWCQGQPGVSRGRGDAPMFFGEKASEQGAFEEQMLPPAAAASLGQSQVVAVSAAAPGKEDSQRSTGGALTPANAGAGSAYTAEVLPRHRGTVRRFFEREK